MELLKAKLIEKIKRASSVESFRFVTDNKIEFIAGQFLQVIFDEVNKDNKELNKYLSFSSSPTKEYIEFTKRLSDSQFSQRLKNLKAGDEVLIKAPMGNCVFLDEYKKIGFLIGGIGITPVISIIEYIVEKKLDTDVVLLYSNRIEEDIAFRKELDHWQSVNKNIKVVYTVTDCEPKGTSCILGRIDKDLFTSNTRDYEKRIIFTFGPPKMVETMKNLCLDTGCDSKNIKTENFIGY
jgi:ferredoxin-NADP reductase